MKENLHAWLQDRLNKQASLQRLRTIKSMSGPQSTQVMVDGETLVNFSSNDYLSMANHPDVKSAMIEGVNRYGVGSGASHLISGHSHAHALLEEQISDWLGLESAVLFSSGYLANLAMLTCFVGKEDLIVQDKLNHASLIDGGLQSIAKVRRFKHCDTDSLSQQLTGDYRFKWLVSDGVFSMDGDCAPLVEYSPILKEHQASLMIDDAHGLGVLGRTGAGSLELSAAAEPHAIQDIATLVMGTFGKAIGTSGAFIAGDKLMIEQFVQFARSFMFTTAMPASVAFATSKSIELIRSDIHIREKLVQNIAYFKQCAEQAGIVLLPSDTAIQPILIHDDQKCIQLAQDLYRQGFWVGAIRPPTVAEGSARLRVTLNSNHSNNEIEQLIVNLNRIMH